MSAPAPTRARPSRPDLRRTSTALSQADAGGWGVILTALAIDLADFLMIGPIGVVAGFFVGGILTLALTLANGQPLRRAAALALLGGIYCMLPITDVVPLATMLTLLRMFLARRQAKAQQQAQPQAPAQARIVQLPAADRRG